MIISDVRDIFSSQRYVWDAAELFCNHSMALCSVLSTTDTTVDGLFSIDTVCSSFVWHMMYGESALRYRLVGQFCVFTRLKYGIPLPSLTFLENMHVLFAVQPVRMAS